MLKKVAIINRTNFKNYGSVLQCYALFKAVKNLGYDCTIMWEAGSVSANNDFRIKKILGSCFKLLLHPSLIKKSFSMAKAVNEKVISDKTVELFNNFVDSNIEREYLTYSRLKSVAKSEYYKFICGSDQVWCSTTLYVDPLMYLRFAPKWKRVAYAPSIGRDFIPRYNARKMKKYISDIPYLSIREKKGQELISRLIGQDIPVVLDPTLLIDLCQWRELEAKQNFDFQYILCYFLDCPTETTQRKIDAFARENNTKIIALGAKLEFISDVIYPDCGPSEFLGIVDDSFFVITDSYHGMLFSIIFEKQFIAVERVYKEYNQSSRQFSVLEELNLNDRYVRESNAFPINIIDYKIVKSRLSSNIEYSLKYLESALNGASDV